MAFGWEPEGDSQRAERSLHSLTLRIAIPMNRVVHSWRAPKRAALLGAARIVASTLGILLYLLALDSVRPALAQNSPGRIVGRVVDASNGSGLAFANVTLLGTSMGANTRDDGSFAIERVPTGVYTLQVSYLGYKVEKREVTVASGIDATVDLRLQPTIAKQEKEIVITGERPLVEVEKASTTRSFNEQELKNLTLEPTLDSVVEQQPGVTRDNNQIHIRGGRAEETLFIIDGVQMRDVLSGESKGSNVSARSVAELNIVTGGFDAKFGQALSGIVEAKLKEGGESYHGYLGYTSDRLFHDWETDLLDFQIGGPLPLLAGVLRPLAGQESKVPTFFLNVASDLSNGYLPSIKDLPRGATLRALYSDKLLGSDFDYGRFFVPRASNDWRFLFKTAWNASDAHKFSLSVTKTLSFDQGFTDVDVSEVNRNKINYPWAWKDRLDHYYTVSSDQNSFSFSWKQVLNKNLFHTLKATRYFSGRNQSTRGHLWNEYDIDFDSNHRDEGTDRPFYRDFGDAADFRDRFTETWGLDWDWQRKTPRHDVQWGGRAQYENVQYLSLDATSVTKDRPLGDEFDLFHVFPTTGALYLQDRLEYEDLIAGIGLRYDYWFPGKQVERLYDRQDRPTINAETRAQYYDDTQSLFGNRFKGRFSPRIQVSHPVTEHDHLFFNYGHFTQRPPYFYVYAKSSSQSSEEFPLIGNPNLNPEVSVQYELGMGHQIRSNLALKSSLFYKDIYDYPTSTTLVLGERSTNRSNFFVYRNLDYARSRGIEIELRKRGGGRNSWAGAYTYSLVKGKSSDPNKLKLVQGSGGDARETSLDEEFMWWNRPHKLTVWYDFKVRSGERDARLARFLPVPQDFSLNLFYKLESGRAYTPQDNFRNDTGPQYSKSGPMDQTINGTVVKGLRVGGRRIEITLQGWNLTDHRTLLVVDPATGGKYVPGEGTLIGDTAPATVERYLDPSQKASPRQLRLGLGMEF